MALWLRWLVGIFQRTVQAAEDTAPDTALALEWTPLLLLPVLHPSRKAQELTPVPIPLLLLPQVQSFRAQDHPEPLSISSSPETRLDNLLPPLHHPALHLLLRLDQQHHLQPPHLA